MQAGHAVTPRLKGAVTHSIGAMDSNANQIRNNHYVQCLNHEKYKEKQVRRSDDSQRKRSDALIAEIRRNPKSFPMRYASIPPRSHQISFDGPSGIFPLRRLVRRRCSISN